MSKFFSSFMGFLKSPTGPTTTHFWGPVFNAGFVAQGVIDWNRPAEKISFNMQTVLTVYSLTFMRFAWRVNPRNYMLFAVHTSNVFVQGRLLLRRWSWEKEFPEKIAEQKAS